MEILGINYEISKFKTKEGHDHSMGASHSKYGVIRVCEEMPIDIYESTLVHEIIHQISDKLGLELSETQIRGLETGIFPFIDKTKLK